MVKSWTFSLHESDRFRNVAFGTLEPFKFPGSVRLALHITWTERRRTEPQPNDYARERVNRSKVRRPFSGLACKAHAALLGELNASSFGG